MPHVPIKPGSLQINIENESNWRPPDYLSSFHTWRCICNLIEPIVPNLKKHMITLAIVILQSGAYMCSLIFSFRRIEYARIPLFNKKEFSSVQSGSWRWNLIFSPRFNILQYQCPYTIVKKKKITIVYLALSSGTVERAPFLRPFDVFSTPIILSLVDTGNILVFVSEAATPLTLPEGWKRIQVVRSTGVTVKHTARRHSCYGFFFEVICIQGKTGVTADRDKIELELNNLNSILSRSAMTPVF